MTRATAAKDESGVRGNGCRTGGPTACTVAVIGIAIIVRSIAAAAALSLVE